MSNDLLYKKAEEKVEKKVEFYRHFIIYCIINIMLAIINYITTPNEWWFYFVSLFWGIGIISHYVSVFGLGNVLNDQWKEKKINEEMEKMKK